VFVSQPRILRIGVSNYRSLVNVDLTLGPLNVLVGPNGAGKSNLLSVFRFLASLIRLDLNETLENSGGLDNVLFRGSGTKSRKLTIELEALATQYSSPNATDVYNLSLRGPRGGRFVYREESFRFKRTQGQGRRITIHGDEIVVQDEVRGRRELRESRFGINERSLGLSTLPRLAENAGGKQVREFNDLLSSFVVFDVNVAAARQPSRVDGEAGLKSDASNLAAFLQYLAARTKISGSFLRKTLGECCRSSWTLTLRR
jgi:predicted ATPase